MLDTFHQVTGRNQKNSNYLIIIQLSVFLGLLLRNI